MWINFVDGRERLELGNAASITLIPHPVPGHFFVHVNSRCPRDPGQPGPCVAIANSREQARCEGLRSARHALRDALAETEALFEEAERDLVRATLRPAVARPAGFP